VGDSPGSGENHPGRGGEADVNLAFPQLGTRTCKDRRVNFVQEKYIDPLSNVLYSYVLIYLLRQRSSS